MLMSTKAMLNRVQVILLAICCLSTALSVSAAPGARQLVFSCDKNNDLYRVLVDNGIEVPRYDTPDQAVAKAPKGAGVLILADGYPKKQTPLAKALFERAAEKRLRLFIEYPASLPGFELVAPRRTALERAIVVSDDFGKALKPMQLVVIHDCHFVGTKTEVKDPSLVLAKVAGYDTAVYGIKDVTTHPILFEHPDLDVLVSTTKLSQFVTARYAPKDAWQAIWRHVFAWLDPKGKPIDLEWTPTVRPTYAKDEKLPADATRAAIIRGIDWHTNARMLIHSSWEKKYDEYYRTGRVSVSNPVTTAPDLDWPAGDGEHALLEGFSSRVFYDGSQPARWWRRTDSIGESALAFALRSKVDGDERSARIAGNLLDWLYFDSDLYRDDPDQANFGLLRWATNTPSLYGDNDIKAILSCMGTAAVLDTDRWDEVLLQNIIGNFRTTGKQGFRGHALNDPALVRDGWQAYWNRDLVSLHPHFEAWIWASYIWAYDKTKDPVLLERTRSAIERMMEAYPNQWSWTNGIQQERGRMLLTLAWLIRVDDQPKYREWLRQIAKDMQRSQDESGAIREELGPPGRGMFSPPRSNAAYGTNEASAIHQNGDPMADMLYTCNFAFLGLHEAYAATGDPLYREMSDKLAEFFVRIQVKSENHPELDGAWFRCFDYEKWDFFGSNADHGWGAWSIEVGWTQAWIPTVLAMRELDVNLWGMTEDSGIAKHWEETKEVMLTLPKPKTLDHAALGAKAELTAPASSLYAGNGAASLTDGILGGKSHANAGWLGFEGDDMTAIIDLGEVTEITSLGISTLRVEQSGIYLPKSVEFAASSDGRDFRVLTTVKDRDVQERPNAPVFVIGEDGLDAQARFLRVRARNVGTIPAGKPGAGKKSWLFVDEVLVNPEIDQD